MALVLKANKDERTGHRGWIPLRIIKAFAIGQLFITIPVLALAVLGFSYIDEVKYQNPPLGQFNFYKNYQKITEAISNYRFPLVRILGYNPDFQDVYLDIKQANYRRLEFTSQYDQQLRRGIKDLNTVFSYPTTRQNQAVPATIRLDGKAIPVKLRLKGDRTLHWTTPDRWSFRIDVSGDHTIFGMKSFSVQRAVARNYIYEWLYHKILKREGLIGLRYQFVTLHVNGRSQGVYVVEEHFRKHLIENNRRREGPILAFGEEVSLNPSDIWAEMPVVPYEASRWQRDDPDMLTYATGLIEGFRSGRLKFQEVFDVELWGRFFAVCDLLEAFHGAVPKSVKLYFNPVSQRIEPIGFDAHFRDKQYPILIAEIGDWRDPGGLWGWGSWFQAIFDNDITDNYPIWEAYVRNLERLSRPEYLAALFNDIGDELDANLDFIYSEFPYSDLQTGHPLTGLSPTFYFSPKILYDRQNFIRARLRPEAGLFAYVEAKGADYIDLNVTNRQKLPLEIVEATYGGRTYRSSDKVRISGRQRDSQAKSRVIRLFVEDAGAQLVPASTKQAKRVRDRITYKIVGATDVLTRRLFDWYSSEPATPMNEGKLAVLESLAFLDVDHANKTIAVRKGEWQLSQDLVIPQGYRLTVGPGTVIDLVAGARIVTYGAVHFEGLPDAPIVVRSSDGTGQGLVVLKAGAPSSFQHVAFENLALDPAAHWKLTSVLVFYESDVTFDHALFCKNKSEDALNIVRSHFAIRDSTFTHTYSDAFDSDFSDGQIEHTKFFDVGNDSIDVSGTKVAVSDVEIKQSGDKGISVGENSRVEAARVSINGVNIGVGVKDYSALDAIDLTIKDSTVGYALYQKKPEFGPASANTWRTLMQGVANPFWVEDGSTLIDDGHAIPANRTKVLHSLPTPDASRGELADAVDCGNLIAQSVR
jgi:CotH kinase protein